MNDKSCYCNKYIESCKLTPSELCPSDLASPRELLEDASRRASVLYEQMVDLLKIDCNCTDGANLSKLILNNMVNLERLLFTISTKVCESNFVCYEPAELIRASTFLRALIPTINFIGTNGICPNQNCLDIFYTIRSMIVDFSVNVAAVIDLLYFSYIETTVSKTKYNSNSVKMPSMLNRFNSNTQVCSTPSCCNPSTSPVPCVDQSFSRLLLITLSLSLNTNRLLLDLFINGAIFKPEPLCREVVKIIYTDSEQIRFNADSLLTKLSNVNFVCKKGAIATRLFDVANISKYIASNLKYVEYLKESENDFDRCRAASIFASLVTLSSVITTILATIEATIIELDSPNSTLMHANSMRSFFNTRSYSMEVL